MSERTINREKLAGKNYDTHMNHQPICVFFPRESKASICLVFFPDEFFAPGWTLKSTHRTDSRASWVPLNLRKRNLGSDLTPRMGKMGNGKGGERATWGVVIKVCWCLRNLCLCLDFVLLIILRCFFICFLIKMLRFHCGTAGVCFVFILLWNRGFWDYHRLS